jgi:S-adenosylmethionine decarboxylase
MYKNFKGNHILVDYIGLYGDEKELGEFIFNLMIQCIENTKMKIVHRQLVILNGDTQPGFTSVLLLDESHMTSHCYSDEGNLAVDIFTCGQTDTFKVIENFNHELLKKYPDVKITYQENHKRFYF